MHTWHWHTWNDLPYLACSLLASWPHGFFTRHWHSRSPAELAPVLAADAAVFRVKQVHGNTVLTPSDLNAANGTGTDILLEADGLVTEAANQSVWVASADCVPVLIADGRRGQTAAVHAGWRGTAQRIVPTAIERLQAQGSRLEDLRVAMGPAIAGSVYQVSTTVAAQVGSTILPTSALPQAHPPAHPSTHPLTPEAIDQTLAQLRQLPDSPILADEQSGRSRLDIRRVNALQLEQLGLTAEQVAIAPYCTYQNPDQFFSYRRQPLKQVQWSGIVSRPGQP
ncbi:MAG: peptidoglycan editing factor PgeF [Synechococcales bacterium]|nr:peptidoglycan editing factor PgeF [Synechococcales bacterium]